jgi:hypothetical protein
MVELNGNTLTFSFPEVHPDAKLSISFQRTCRIPDDGKNYPLPASLGQFPLRHVDDYAKRAPREWEERGGVMMPMYQAEAMWIHFSPNRSSAHGTKYPFAVKVAAGKMSAVTGKPWQKKLHEGDYVVTPLQPWLDGFVVEEGVIRQFVAMPLGMGATVEEQATGKAEWGGIQFEVFPMKREAFERRFPKQDTSILRTRNRRGWEGASLYSCDSINVVECSAPIGASMGLGAGGTMKQQIFADPYGKDEWQKKLDGRRCYVHLANSMAWEAITKEKAPSTPITAQTYKRNQLPWFDHYEERPAVSGPEAMKAIKSVLAYGFQHGIPTLPENESIKVKKVTVLKGPTPPTPTVRDGFWA